MSKKSCPSRDELSGYVQGTLPPSQAESVTVHLAECADCEDTIQQLEPIADPLINQIREAPTAEPYLDEAACRKAVESVERHGPGIGGPGAGEAAPTAERSMVRPAAEQVRPMSRAEFVEFLTTFGFVAAGELTAVEKQLPPAEAADVQALARALVAHGKLTKYQAAAAYQGKGKSLVYGDYLVLDRIGAGGMGQVFKARHKRMDRIVALKVLSSASMKNADAVKRFEREVRAAAKLIHPNIVHAYDAGVQDGVHYLVMEFVDGPDLSSLVRKQGKLAVKQACEFIAQAARGFAFAHGKGIVHRDIKPGNLLVDHDGTVKVLDMGLARFDDLGGGLMTEGELTQSGALMGTVDYMAPEQALNTSLADAKSDVYGLGCTLYRLLTGDAVYGGQSMVEKILAHREQPVPALRRVRPDAPQALEALAARMLAKSPADRPSMQEIADALTAIASGAAAPPAAPFVPQAVSVAATAAPVMTAPRTRGAMPPRRRSNTGLVAAAAAGALFVALGIWVYINNNKGERIAAMNVPEGSTISVVPDGTTSGTATPSVLPSGTGTSGTAPSHVFLPPAIPTATATLFTPPTAVVGTPSAVPAGPVDLLALVQLPRDVLTGNWSRNGATLVGQDDSSSRGRRLVVPFTPLDEQYDLVLTGKLAQSIPGQDSLFVGMAAEGKQFFLRYSGKGCGISDGDATKLPDYTPRDLDLTSPFTIVCAVRKGSVRTDFNGQMLLDYRGEFSTLLMTKPLPAEHQRKVFLDFDGSATLEITSFRYVPVVGAVSPAIATHTPAPGSVGTTPADPALVCEVLASMKPPVGPAAGAVAFVGPAGGPVGGDTNSGNGLIVAPPAAWQTEGTAWSCVFNNRNGGGLQFIHPFRNGHVRIDLEREQPSLFPGGAWTGKAENIYSATSTFPAPRTPEYAKFFTIRETIDHAIESKLDAAGRYALSINGLVVLTAQVDAVAPQQLNPPFTDPNCPAALAVGQAAIIVNPAYRGHNEAHGVRLTTEKASAALPANALLASAGAVDLLALVRLPQDGVEGKWYRHGTTLIGAAAAMGRVQVPHSPTTDEYDLVLSGRQMGTPIPAGVVLGLVVEGRQSYVRVGRSSAGVSDGDTAKAPNYVDYAELPLERPFTLLCSVRNDGVRVRFNGRPLCEFLGDLRQWSGPPISVPRTDQMFLAIDSDANFQFTTFRIAPAAGPSPLASSAAPASAGSSPVDATLVCRLLAAQKQPFGLAAGATAFDGAPGNERSGANGFAVAAPSGWQTGGTAWHCTYIESKTAQGLYFIHPFRDGHIRVMVQKLRAEVFTGGPWKGEGIKVYTTGSTHPVTRTAADSSFFPLVDNQSYAVVSRLDPSGKYELALDGQVVLTSQIGAVQPQGFKPPFEDPRCPATLALGHGAMIIGPMMDPSRNEALDVRFSTAATVELPPPAVPSTASLPVPTSPDPERRAVEWAQPRGAKIRVLVAGQTARPGDGDMLYGREPPAEAFTVIEVDFFEVLNRKEFRRHFTDADLKYFSGLRALYKLRLPYGQFTDAGLAELAPLKTLDMLDLSETTITDAGLAHLAPLTNLTRLHLNRTAVTDAGLVHLASLPKLRHLELHGTRITAAGVAQLKAARPSVTELKWDETGPPAQVAGVPTSSPAAASPPTFGPPPGFLPPALGPTAAAPASPASRQPLPELSAKQAALAAVKDVFKDDYAAAKTPAKKSELATKLYEQSRKAADPTERYVLLEEAVAFGVEGDDIQSARSALYEMAAGFQVPAAAKYVAGWKDMLGGARPPETVRALLTDMNRLFDGAVKSAEFDDAKAIGDYATTTAQRLRDVAEIKLVRDRNAELAVRHKEHAAAKTALEKLATTPDDPEANLAVGRYRAIVEKDWVNALALLAKGSDPVWKDLAVKTLAAGNQPAAVSAVADAWWDAAQTKPAQKAELAAGARFWYQAALGSLAGLQKTRVENRIAEAGLLAAESKIPITLLPLPASASEPSATAAAGEKPFMPVPAFGDPKPAASGATASPRAIAERVLAMRGTVSLDIGGREVRISALNELPAGDLTITSIDLDEGQAITDADLPAFATLPRLKRIYIQGSKITGSGLATLTTLPELEFLRLDRGVLNDAAMDHIAKMKKLNYLDVAFTQITDAGLAKLVTLSDLQVLYSQGNRVTAAGLNTLLPLEKLINVNLDETKVDDAAITVLAKLPNLQILTLRNTLVTDASVASFLQMKNLRKCNLQGTRFTQGAVDKVTQVLPNSNLRIK
jgi:hypothetical protein